MTQRGLGGESTDYVYDPVADGEAYVLFYSLCNVMFDAFMAWACL